MFDFECYTMLVGQTLADVDPQGLAVRPTTDALCDLLAVLRGCFSYGMTVEDAALMVLCSETVIN